MSSEGSVRLDGTLACQHDGSFGDPPFAKNAKNGAPITMAGCTRSIQRDAISIEATLGPTGFWAKPLRVRRRVCGRMPEYPLCPDAKFPSRSVCGHRAFRLHCYPVAELSLPGRFLQRVRVNANRKEFRRAWLHR